jgi:hypothetical protein
MVLRLGLLLSLLLFLCQLVVSIFFSSEIVNQNNLYNQLKQQQEKLLLQQRELQISLSANDNLQSIDRYAASRQLVPFTQKIVISP